MAEAIVIDGKEAGGQILRTALGLSAITGKSIKVVNIRGSRPCGGGLKVQHFEGLLAATQLCNAKLTGAELGSREIDFIPGKLEPKELNVNIKTAGSIGLLFQSLQLAAAFTGGDVKVRVNGGSTASMWSPPVQYFQSIFLPIVQKMGYSADIKIIREGFYPKGGADVQMVIHPVKELQAVKLLDRGEVKSIKGISIAGSLPEHVAKRQTEAAEKILKNECGNVDIETRVVKSLSPGTSMTVWAECENSILGADAIGERGVPAEKVGAIAANGLMQLLGSNATLDKYMADQILPMMALANGRSEVTVEDVTEHCRTNIAVCEQLLGVKFEIEGRKISVDGRPI